LSGGELVIRKEMLMMRQAFVMKLKLGFEEEYKRRHDAIWPELARELSAAGVSDYSIFLDRRTGNLFAVQELADGNTADRLPQAAIVKKWWAYMKDIMETNPDNSPVAVELAEVFHMD
jgi:L-rhamnose mutarotase